MGGEEGWAGGAQVPEGGRTGADNSNRAIRTKIHSEPHAIAPALEQIQHEISMSFQARH